jgi:hypothetical protein
MATEDDQDVNNPSQQNYEHTFNDPSRELKTREEESAGESEPSENRENSPSSTDNASSKSNHENTPTQNTDDARNKEQNSPINYTGSGTPSKKKPATIKGQLKGRGAIGIAIALLVGGVGGLTVLFSPGILLVDLKEKYIEKFNDQLAVMDNQSMLLLKKKFTGQGVVTGCKKLSLRCKINTLSDRQLRKLEKRGDIKVNSTEVTALKGRHKIDSFEFQGRTIRAPDLIREARASPEFRMALRYGYNPKLAGFADSAFTKLAKRVGINKRAVLSGGTDEEIKKSLRKSVSGAGSAEIDAKVTADEENCNGGDGCVDGKRTTYKDVTTGATISKDEYDKRISASSALSSEIEARKSLSETGKEVAKGTLKGALTTTALGLGAVDSACTGYILIRTVGFAAKYIGMLQLLRYFHMFGNTADAGKAGDLTPEVATFLGNTITSTNSQGKSGTDSYGYMNTVYGDVNPMPRSDGITAESTANGVQLSSEQKEQIRINDETTKYINGQLVSNNLLTSVINLTGKTGSAQQIDDACGFVKSGWGQTIVIGAAVVGAVAAFFSGGATLGWGIVAQASVSVAITVAIAMLTPKLVDMASGTLITGDENGNQAVNAATSGAGALNAQTAMAGGIPLLQKEDAVTYQQHNEDVLAQLAEEDRLQYGPLDPSNRHTFMGSVVSTLLPYTSKMATNTSSIIPSITALVTNSFASIIPKAKAASIEQYKICQDVDYVAENLAVDPFCNPRAGLNDRVLAMDPERAIDYMEAGHYVLPDSEDGAPASLDNEYAKYIADCTERTVPIGGYTESNPDKGTKCIQGRSQPADEAKYEMFRKYFITNRVTDGQDNGEVAKTGQSSVSPVLGDARALALQVADNPNIMFANPATKEQLKIFANGGQVFDPCSNPMTVSKYLLGALQANSTKYTILINNIGFKQDRDRCETGTLQHPKGTAVDLNDITIIGGASTGGNISLPGSDLAIVNQYATDFLAVLPLNRGGVGQKDYGVNPVFPPGSVALNGTHLFPDAGNHLHIDARNRENLNDTE